MNCRTVFFATMLCIFAISLERSFMLHAADKNPTEPGPSDKDAPKEFTETKSGLKYRILRKTDGTKPTARDEVNVHYKGWLDSGKVFDSSYGPRKEPISFPLKGVIRGWTEGLQLIGKGGMIELEIPSDLGYGDNGFPPDIPPKATLHFIVELLDVIPAPTPVKPGPVDKDAPEEFTTTKSGLKYRVRRKSDGKKPTADSTVEAHFKAWINDDNVLQDTFEQGKAEKVPLQQLSLRGLSEGMQLIGKGGMIELDVPPELAFGEKGRPPVIPPKARVRFLIEVIDVK